MSLKVAEKISRNLQATPFYTIIIMAGETTDCSNKEQFVVCFCSINSDFEMHEDFVGLQDVKCIDAETLSVELKDISVRLNFSPNKMRGQCNDGASCMAGVKSGVTARPSKDNLKQCTHIAMGMLYSLACSNAIKQCKDNHETIHEITKLIKLPTVGIPCLSALRKCCVQIQLVFVLCPHR